MLASTVMGSIDNESCDGYGGFNERIEEQRTT
jgi:hypothetical protein